MKATLTKAIEFARAKHLGQQRKITGEDYINHPLEVLRLLIQHGPHDVVTEEMEAAAVLHDVLEDTDTTEQELRDLFGDQITGLVVELTEPRHQGNRYLRKAILEPQRLATISAEAQTIKCADILANLSDIDQHDSGFAPIYKHEKQRALMLMNKAYGPLRDTAWLATLPRGEMK